VVDVGAIEQIEMVEVRCDAPDFELLLVSWVKAVIYEMAVRRMLFSKFRIALRECSLTGNLAGEKADPERYQVAVEGEGATVSALKVTCDRDGQWLAHV
jgi:SHS2 domain-containing protein